MAKEATSIFNEFRISLSKEQCEMLAFLKNHYEEPSTNIIKKALERLYQSIKTKD